MQVIVASATIHAKTVVFAQQILTAVEDVLPGPFVAWPTGAIAVLAAISAAVSRVMAIPAVDEWMRKLGAGSAPAGAVVAQIDGNATPTNGGNETQHLTWSCANANASPLRSRASNKISG